jgi:hypothetical protein
MDAFKLSKIFNGYMNIPNDVFGEIVKHIPNNEYNMSNCCLVLNHHKGIGIRDRDIGIIMNRIVFEPEHPPRRGSHETNMVILKMKVSGGVVVNGETIANTMEYEERFTYTEKDMIGDFVDMKVNITCLKNLVNAVHVMFEIYPNIYCTSINYQLYYSELRDKNTGLFI